MTTTETRNKFAVYFDDGEHEHVLEKFATEKEAFSYYHEQIKLFKSGDKTYQPYYNDDYDAEFEVVILDDEECWDETITSWNKEDNN